MAAGSWNFCLCTRGLSRNPGPCSMYCSGTRGTSRNPKPFSLKCADCSLMSPGLSIRDVGVGRVGGSVQSGASPRCSLARSSELSVGDVGEADVGARLSPGRAVKGAENRVRVNFATIWRGSGRLSDTTLLAFFMISQSRCLHDWRLYCTGCPGSFCGQPLVRSDMGGVGGVGRAFCCRRYRLLLHWDPCWSRPGLDPGDADARGAGPGTVAISGLLAGFDSLLNGPSRRRGCMSRRRGSSGGVWDGL